MQHFRPTLAFKRLIPLPPILYILPLLPHHRLLLLAALLHLLLPLPSLTPSRVLQWNAVGLRAKSTELLNFLSSHLVDIICIQPSNHNSSSSFWIPGFSALRSDRTHSQLVFSLLMPRTLAAALLFLSGRAYSLLNFLPLLSRCLIPTLLCGDQHLSKQLLLAFIS